MTGPGHDAAFSRRRVITTLGAGTAMAWATPTVLRLSAASAAAGSAMPGGGGVGACAQAVVSGGPDPSTAIQVDDDLTVWLGSNVVFSENDDYAGGDGPVALGSVRPGDRVRVAANDSAIFGGGRELSPLYLHCLTTGAVQVLDPVGFPRREGFPPSDDVFYDRTFTVR